MSHYSLDGRLPQPETFRRWFLIALILLGLYIGGNAVLKIHG
jgi:uncharacterized protein